MKRSIVVHFKGQSQRVAWYAGASDASIREAIREILAIPNDSNFVLKDEDGTIVAIHPSLPDGLHLKAEQRTSENSSILEDPKNAQGTSANSFRGELLKFERINAHLANERTWLAWVRTALSTLSCAFAFLSLSDAGYYQVMVYTLGSLFCAAMMVVYLTGWLRYTRVKLILGLSFSEM